MSTEAAKQSGDQALPSKEYDEFDDYLGESFSGHFVFNNSQDLTVESEKLHNLYNNFNDVNYVLVSLYVPIIVTAMIANILVIFIVLKNQYMRSVTNYFVVNLSVSDLLVTIICMPIGITQAVSITWIYGSTMCKLFYYLQGVAVAASVFTITTMSIDRYLAIRRPISVRGVINRKVTIIIIVTIWLVSLTIFSPVLGAATLRTVNVNNITLSIRRRNASNEIVEVFTPPSLYFCSEEFHTLGIDAHVFGMTCFILVYAIPGFMVIVTYSMMGRTLCSRKPPFDCDSTRGSASSQQGMRLVRERKRVAWILLIMAILFALCWLPYNVLRMLVDYKVIAEENKLVPNLISYGLLLGHANSSLNPVVYCFMTRNFRRHVSEILCRIRYGIARRNTNHKTPAADAGASEVCRRTLRNRTISNVGLVRGVRSDGTSVQAAVQSREKFTTSTGCDSFDNPHIPHRSCYMLKYMTKAQACRHEKVPNSPEKQSSDMRADESMKFVDRAPIRN